MCVNPSFVFNPDGAEYGRIPVPCRKCWQCRRLRQDDYVGRCLCEQAASRWSVAVTLTYRDSEDRELDQAHKTIFPRHFQLWIKRLRFAGHLIRYLGAGETGKLNGRAHFHAILFGRSAPPDWPNDRRERWIMNEWDHGFVSTEFAPAAKTMRYVVKYILKDDGWFTVSKKPPLGHQFFLDLAARHHALGVISQHWEYRPPGAENGRTYLMSGAVRRDYLRELAELSGVDLTALPDRGNEWVKKACYKVDRWETERRERRELVEFPQQSWRRLVEEIDRKRPKLVKPTITGWEFDPDIDPEQVRRGLAAIDASDERGLDLVHGWTRRATDGAQYQF